MARTVAFEGPEAQRGGLATKVVDAHQHFWWRDRARYAWLDPNDPVLARDFTPEDLRPQLPAAGVEQTLVVQADPSMEETQCLLEMAEQTDFVVAWWGGSIWSVTMWWPPSMTFSSLAAGLASTADPPCTSPRFARTRLRRPSLER